MTNMRSLASCSKLQEIDGSAWDVVVLGAGPCGCAAAFESARLGARTLLVDRSEFPRDKACGCCLGAEGVKLASAIWPGVAKLCENPIATFDRLRIQTPGASYETPIPGGVVSARSELDLMLARGASSAGALFLHGVCARLGEDSCDRRVVSLRRGERTVSVQASVVIAAVGLRGRFREGAEAGRRLIRRGAPMGVSSIIRWPEAPIPAKTVSMRIGTNGYVGMARLGDGRINIAAALSPAFVRSAGGPAQAVGQTLDRFGVNVSKALDSATWLGAPTLTQRTPMPVDRRLLIAGDAAGYVEPFTGEGMTLSLKSGFEAGAIAASAANDGWRHAHAERWLTFIRSQMRKQHRRCAALACVIARPTLAMIVLRLLDQDRDASRIITRLFTGPTALGSAA